MSSEDQQTQFDWQAETAKCVEGIQFDEDQDYTFTLVFDEVSLHAMTKKDGSVITYKKGDKAGQPVKLYTFPFKMEEANVTMKLDFFHSDNYRINPSNPELEDPIVQFSRKVGYNPVLDGDFSPRDFIKPGLSFTAKVIDQPQTEDQKKAGKKPYKTIDISSIRLTDGGEGGETQDHIEKIPKEIQEEVLALAKGCKKFPELVAKINKAKKTEELLAPAMSMKEQGILKL